MVSVTFLKICCQSNISFSCCLSGYSGLVDDVCLEAFSFQWTVEWHVCLCMYVCTLAVSFFDVLVSIQENARRCKSLTFNVFFI